MRNNTKKLLSLLLAAMLMLSLTGCSASDYKEASKLMESGDYSAASAIFKTLEDYKDSSDLAKQCDYEVAKSTYAAGDYQQASELFAALGDYEDSAALSVEASDKALAQKLVGEWITEDVDMTDMLVGEIETLIGSDEESQKALSYVDFGSLTVRAVLTVAEDGSCVAKADKDSVTALTEQMFSALSDGMTAYLDDSIAQIAEENGMTTEELYSSLGVASIDEVFEAALGSSLSDYIKSLAAELDFDAVLENSVEGKCTVESSVVSFVLNEEDCPASYDADSDVLVITDSDMGDISFYRTSAA